MCPGLERFRRKRDRVRRDSGWHVDLEMQPVSMGRLAWIDYASECRIAIHENLERGRPGTFPDVGMQRQVALEHAVTVVRDLERKCCWRMQEQHARSRAVDAD